MEGLGFEERGKQESNVFACKDLNTLAPGLRWSDGGRGSLQPR